MTARRPKREKAPPPPVEHDDSKWSLKEKRRLQRALLKYSPQQVDNIAKIIVTKTVTEIRAYLDKMEERLKLYAENRPKEAIESWSTLATNLISCEMKDYSEVLSEVMAVAANMEERDTPSQSDDSDNIPDYDSIYKYISMILAGEDLPFLGKIECSIVLDLMHSLIDTIRTHDTSKQQEIMLQKYDLLTSKIDLNDTMVHVERCRKAINNDYSDFQTFDNGSKNTSSKPVPSTSTGGPSTSTGGPSTSTGGPTTNQGALSIVVVGPSSDNKITTSQIKERALASTGDNSLSTVTSTPSTKTPPTKGKGKGGPIKRKPNTLVPLPTKKSKMSKSPENVCSQEKQTIQSSDSSQVKLNNTSLSGNCENSSPIDDTVNSCKEMENRPGTSSDNTPNNLSRQTSTENINKESSNNDNETTKQKETIPKKPALFTLNPFCIPIDLLKFQRLVPSEVMFNPVIKTHQMVQRIFPQRNKSRFKIEEQKNSEKEVEVICVDEKQDVIRREKFISIIREDINNEDNKHQ